MYAKVYGETTCGINGEQIIVEVDISNGLPSFDIVGLPDTSVKESRERVRAALKNSGLIFPMTRITVNLAPADLKKDGSGLDLPIAVGILVSSGVLQQEQVDDTIFVGELALDGTIRQIAGVLPMILHARDIGRKNIVIPAGNCAEGRLVDGIDVLIPASLLELVEHLRGEKVLDVLDKEAICAAATSVYDVDFAEVRGQQVVKRAMEIAAAGAHNMLMIGPTGSGKTYLVKTLARLLKVPLAITDATSLTEAGYIGDDIESVVSKLLQAADNDVEKAERGIIFIDEIDKIAKKKETRSRDVSGESVQQGMLKLLEGSDIEVPVGATSKNAMVPQVTVNTRNILFICGGAFPDLENIIKARLNKQSSIGFNSDLKDKYDNDKNILSKVELEDLREFGMIPEFLGRLPIVFSLEVLTEDMLVKIMKEPKNAILKQYQKLLELDEVKLEFDDDALRQIAKKAMEKDTGARALRSIIEEYMLDIMYEIPKDDNIGSVTITADYIEKKGTPLIMMRGQERLPMNNAEA